MWCRILKSTFALALGISALPAQTPDLGAVGSSATPTGGTFSLQSVSGFGAYYSSGAEGIVSNGYNLNGNAQVGGSMLMAYMQSGERSGLSIIYTPSFVRSIQSSGFGASSHVLSLDYRHNWTPRWSYNLSTSGTLMSLSEALAEPAVPAVTQPVAAGPTTLPVPDSTLTTLFYGNRFLTAALQARASYSYSSRASLHFGISASRIQNLADNTTPEADQSGYLVSQTTSGSVNVGMDYSLSPRTQVGVDALSGRTSSSLYDASTSSLNVSLSHRAGVNWSFQTHVGAGYIDPIRQYYIASSGPGYQAGGGVEYKTRAHIFDISVDRSVSDPYGFGASATLSTNGSWTWSRPGASWWWLSSFGQQHLSQSALGTIDSWHATAGLGRRLAPHLSSFIQYSYVKYSGVTGGPQRQFVQQSARISFVWTRAATIKN